MIRKVKIPRAILVGCVCAAVAGLIYVARSFSRAPLHGAHLSGVEWLPLEANDVTFYRNGDALFPMYVYECTIPKEAMLRFAEKSGWKLSERKDVHLSDRHLLPLPAIELSGVGEKDVYPFALEYENVYSNGGGTHVVYHVLSQRLYVSYSAN